MEFTKRFVAGSLFRNGHEADMMVVHCSDFRFLEQHQQLISRGLPAGTKDLIAVPGSIGLYLRRAPVPGREAPVALLIEKHKPKAVIFVGHHDCAYYGGDDNAVKRDLLQAKVEMEREYPNLQVVAYFAGIKDDVLVEFIRYD